LSSLAIQVTDDWGPLKTSEQICRKAYLLASIV